MEAVKAFVKTYSTSKTSLRKQLIADLSTAAASGELPNVAVKLSIQALGNTLFRYSDRGSKLAVERVLEQLCSVYGLYAVQSLSAVLEEYNEYFERPGSPSLAKSAVTAFSWSCIAISHCEDPPSYLLHCQAVLLAAIAFGPQRTRAVAVRRVHRLWRSKPVFVVEYVSCLLSGEQYLPALCLLGVLAEYCQKASKLEEAQQEAMLVYFSKMVLASRAEPQQTIVASCASIFKKVTHKQFSSLLLPATLKCLLRNPDELIQAVGFMVSVLPIDCSQYAMDILKNSVAHLSSNQPSTRQHALSLVQSLAQQCSDLTQVLLMVQLLFTTLRGSPSGKLTVTEHRCSALAAIRALTRCPLSTGSQQQLATTAVETLMTYIKQEVHVGTAVTAVNVLRQWCPLLPDSPPTLLTDHIKGALGATGTAPSLRVAYLHCILELCQGERGHLMSEFLPSVLQCLDRAGGSSPQPAALEEALVACHVLFKTSGAVPSQVWSLVDSDLLVSQKLISTAPQESLQVLIEVAGSVLCSENYEIKEPVQKEWLYAVLHVILHGPWSTQKLGGRCVSRVVQRNSSWANVLMEGVNRIVLKGDFLPKPVLLVLHSLATPTHPMREELAIQSLLCSHHPAIVAVSPHTWESVLQSLELDPPQLISQKTSELLATVLEYIDRQPEACKSAMSTLLALGAESLLPRVVEKACTLLGSPGVLEVTEDQMMIMLTPPGQLWNKGMLQELEGGLSGGLEANVKRESKVYSYEDQKWDAQVRQEIQRRQRLVSDGDSEGRRDVRSLLKEAKLSQKQQEAIETEIKYEETIRDRLTQLDHQLANITFTVKPVSGGFLLEHIPQLSKAVLSSLHSPLAAKHCREVWRVLAHSVFREWSLAQLFSEVSLQTLATPSATPSPALPRLLTAVERHSPSSHVLSDAVHTLTLPLLRSLLLSGGSTELRDKAADVLCKAAHDHAAEQEQDGPLLYPMADTLKLLSTLIASGEDTLKGHRLRKSCVDAFIALCKSLSNTNTPDVVLQLLTSNLSDPSPLTRNTALKAFSELGPSCLPSDLPSLQMALLVARHDSDEDNKTLAGKLWDASGFTVSSDLSTPLIDQLSSDSLVMHSSTALALGVWLDNHESQASAILDRLTATYKEKKTVPPPKTDSFGRLVVTEYRDLWENRVGVAKAMEQLPRHSTSSRVMDLLKFIIPGALGDPSSEVQAGMMSAARAAISTHGESLAGELMGHFEQCLQDAPDTHEADTIRQSIVVLMGTLAKHMDKENPKVKAVVHLLLSKLDTPSQQVQEAIANCLPPLATVIKHDAEDILNKLMDKLLNSASFSQRRGSAYGLAGLVKGLGIPTLKQFKVMQTLQEAIKDKKNYRHREGALFAFESLCNMLGRLFEPYVVHLLPDLLLCFGDGNQYVREATDQTARTIMAHLSSHGVKLILPSLLTALKEDSWRTKAGSAELLGAMAYCAPKQLSSCLPSIVPSLMDVLADSHSKVHRSGSQALKQIGSVIKNPEIQVLVPVLLDALADPSNKAQVCLQALLDTEFVHIIDPPSLALIMPTLKRTLEIRSSDTKKMAAQIIGNMYSLTDRKDLAPYLPDVLPGLKQSVVDPVPEVRSVCAKALGAMARGMGDEGLQELLPWLLATLQSESSSVDRSGAAQGLSEVLLAQGVEHLSQLMPRFVESSQDPENPTHVRDGYLMLFVYLPVAFGKEFVPFIGELLPCILKGLADESEFIRETSLLAGQTIVNRYADTAVDLFLPELEKGLFDDNWRIRCSSVQLLGDLLYKISGLSGKMSTESEEDDNFGTEEAKQALLKCLGIERRNRVLAGLYMGRSDISLMVRQSALHVWKVVVTNTARTLKEILPTLISLLLSCLASESYDKRKVAARTLGDLVRKLGERVLPEVIPMLERGLNSQDPQERQGVCIGLSEIIQQTSRENVLLYVDSLLPTVRNALCDEQQEVRAAAAQTFDSLHSTVGSRILDEVLTPLLRDLSQPDKSEVALDGLRQVMAVKSRVVLPHIVPQLVCPPVNTRALSLLSSVAGEALHRHLDRIVPALIGSLQGVTDKEIWRVAEGVVLSVHEEPGTSILIEELFKAARVMNSETRAASMGLLLALCDRSTADLTEHIPQLIIFTAEALNDPSDSVCERAWHALEATVKRVHQKELPRYTGYLRKALRSVSLNLIGEELHGFAIKGITPALTMLKEGLISGSPDEKEEAAKVLVEVIHLASPKTLSAGRGVMLIAGPLIRVLGDRYGWNVKVATLEALVELVRKVGAAAKSFIPQLQTSYLKALNDPNKPVRVQAVTGLTELIPLSPRVDPVFNELHNGVKKSEDPALRLTMLQALRGVIEAGGQRMSEKHRGEILTTLEALEGTSQEPNRLEAAKCLGILCIYLSDSELQSVLKEKLLESEGVSDWAVLQARAVALSSALQSAAKRVAGLGMEGETAKAVLAFATSDRIPVCVSGLQCVGSFINNMESTDISQLLPPLSQALSHSSVDVRVAVCEVCGGIPSPPDQLLVCVIPPLLLGTRDKNTAVKATAERAIVGLVQGEWGLKHCMGLLDGSTAKKLEEIHLKVHSKLSRDL